MKKANLNIILFLSTLFLMTIVNSSGFWKTDTTELENRTLQTKPVFNMERVFSGEFFREYEEYYSDHFMLRNQLIQIGSIINDFRGLNSKDKAEIIVHQGANTAESNESQKDKGSLATSESAGGKTSLPVPGRTDGKAISIAETGSSDSQGKKEYEDISGKILVLNDKAMEIYTAKEKAPNKEDNAYADIINALEGKFNHSVKVYSLLVPTKIEFIEDEKYKTMSSSQKRAIDDVNKSLNKNIISINAYDVLRENRDKYLYFKTDHHWTALGAYYAYTAFAASTGVRPVPVEKYKMGKVEGFLGTTYSATLNKRLQKNPDTIYYYKPFIKHKYTVYYNRPVSMNVLDMTHADKKNKYRIFLSGDRPLGKISTEVKNEKKILIIKDSYGNAFIPFLIPHYEEIYIVDPRQYKSNVLKLIKDNGIQEVLFLNYVPAVDMKNIIDLIGKMMI